MADGAREKKQKSHEVTRQISQESSSSTAQNCVPYKVILTGVKGVGKSSLFLRIRDGEFHDGKSRTNMHPDFCSKEVTIDSEIVKIKIWDTGGMDDHGHHNLSRSYYQGSDVVLYVYSADDQESADDLRLYLDDANGHAPGAKRALVRNKVDLCDQHTNKDEVKNKLKNYHFHFEMDTSALKGDGVNELMTTVANYLLNHAKPVKPTNTFKAYDQSPKTKKEGSSTCC